MPAAAAGEPAVMTATPVPRLTSSGEIAAAVPLLCGFRPRESIVAISLRHPRNRVGLTLRADLVASPALAEQVVRAVAQDDDGVSCVVVVHSDLPDEHPDGAGLPWADLVTAVDLGLAERGVELAEALLVRDGRWSSYRCTRACCPPEGTPLPLDDPTVAQLTARAAFDGRVVLGSREELVASLAPVLPLGAGLAVRLQEQALEALAERVVAGQEAAVRAEVDRWRAALQAWEDQPGRLEPAAAAALAVGLTLVRARDEVATWSLDREDALLGLVQEVARGTAPPGDAPVCALLAWLSWARGDGASASIALDRALSSDPGHSLAGLVRTAVDNLVPPAGVREVTRGTRRDLAARDARRPQRRRR